MRCSQFCPLTEGSGVRNDAIGMLEKEACHAQECALFAGWWGTGMQLGDLTQYGMAAGASKRRIMTLVEGRCTNGRREGEPVELDRWTEGAKSGHRKIPNGIQPLSSFPLPAIQDNTA